jgi:tripartite-type tricarboxylate transporter receptor subunit TctC
MILRLLVVLVAACSFSAAPAFADDWPTKPLKLVIGWTAGGIMDVRGRVLAQRLGKALGQQVVVENRPGGSGTLGANAVARAAPDGYTLLFGAYLEMGAVVGLLANVPYLPDKDFVPIAATGRSCSALLAHSSLKVATPQQLVAYLKQRPGQISYATSGLGTPAHLLMEKFKQVAGVDVKPVHYKGSSQAMPDVISGRVPLMFDFPQSSDVHVRAGTLVPLMTGCARHIDIYPDVPTAREAGFPAVEIRTWSGFFAPAGTPRPIVERLNRELNRIQQSPDVRSHMAYVGAEIPLMTPEEFGEFIREDRPRWLEFMRAAGIKPE